MLGSKCLDLEVFLPPTTVLISPFALYVQRDPSNPPTIPPQKMPLLLFHWILPSLVTIENMAKRSVRAKQTRRNGQCVNGLHDICRHGGAFVQLLRQTFHFLWARLFSLLNMESYGENAEMLEIMEVFIIILLISIEVIDFGTNHDVSGQTRFRRQVFLFIDQFRGPSSSM